MIHRNQKKKKNEHTGNWERTLLAYLLNKRGQNNKFVGAAAGADVADDDDDDAADDDDDVERLYVDLDRQM